MIEEDIAEELSSPWSSSIILVTKKDVSIRFCVDYRRLKEVTKKNSSPLPRIDNVSLTLSDSKWFSILDLKSEYWQVKVHPKDKDKTAFLTGNGLYQLK